MRAIRALVMTVAVLLLAGGSAFALPLAPVIAQELAQVYDGEWTGTTSQGRPIGFAVQGNAVTGVSFGYELPQCGLSGTVWSLITPGIPVTGSTFTHSSQGSGPSSLSWTLSGTFSSPAAASGTLQLTYVSSFPNPSCQATTTATWSATPSVVSNPHTISGTVRDMDGNLVEGARVTVFPDQAGQPPFTSQSAAGGSYSLSVPTGSYDLQASKPGYQAGQIVNVAVPPDKIGFNLTLGPIPSNSISGTVRDDTGSPIAGAQVVAIPTQAGQPITAQTSANGTYSLTVPAGTYGVQASKQGYQPAPALVVTVPPGRANADFTLNGSQTDYAVSGTVRNSLGSPLAGAQVIAFPAQTGQSLTTGQTAADGTYTLRVPAGSYHIQAAAANHIAGHIFDLAVPPDRTDANFALEPTQPSLDPTISGTVRDDKANPIAGATVSATPAGGGQPVAAQTATDGTYTLIVPAGTYTVQASKAGYQVGQALSVSVPPSRAGADLILPGPANLGTTVYLPLVAREQPAPTPTPVTPTPVTPTPVTPVPLPDPVLALDMGTTTGGSPCRVTNPRPSPVTIPAGSTSFAFQLTLRVPDSSSVSVSVSPSFGGGGTRGTGCNDYAVIGGQVEQSRLGAQIERLDRAPIPAGSYKLRITVNGATTEVPFTVQ